MLVALLSVVLSARAARDTAQLQDELERRRQQASKEELLEQVMSRYREPLLRAADKPAIELNKTLMDRYRPEMRKYYYDPTRYKTYLEQLGIAYPTVKK